MEINLSLCISPKIWWAINLVNLRLLELFVAMGQVDRTQDRSQIKDFLRMEARARLTQVGIPATKMRQLIDLGFEESLLKKRSLSCDSHLAQSPKT